MSGRKCRLRLPADTSLADKILYNISVNVAAPHCWNWLGATHTTKGYGRVVFQGNTLKAHRASYETFVGPIPDGLQIDHLCRNRGCVNPEHLEPVTARENSHRSPIAIWKLAAAADRCRRGHLLAAENVYLYKGWRHCRECRRQHGLASYYRSKGVATSPHA